MKYHKVSFQNNNNLLPRNFLNQRPGERWPDWPLVSGKLKISAKALPVLGLGPFPRLHSQSRKHLLVVEDWNSCFAACEPSITLSLQRPPRALLYLLLSQPSLVSLMLTGDAFSHLSDFSVVSKNTSRVISLVTQAQPSRDCSCKSPSTFPCVVF